MLNPLKKLSEMVAPEAAEAAERRREAVGVIESEVNTLRMALIDLAEDRMPCIKMRQEIDGIKNQLDQILAASDMDHHDLPEYLEVMKLSDHLKMVTLERYAKLIPLAGTVTPFATYQDIYRNRMAETEEQKEILIVLYECAVKALFSHPKFTERLSQMLDHEVQMLVRKEVGENDFERAKIRLFIENFEQCKLHHESVARNVELSNRLSEFQALMFFQEETVLLREERQQPCEDLSNHINHWMQYLNSLTAFEQSERRLLIEVANECSEAYNQVVADVERSEQL